MIIQNSTTIIAQADASGRLPASEALFAAWIFGLSGTVAAGWILSEGSILHFAGVAGLLVWLAVSGWLYKASRSWKPAEVADFGFALRFPPFLILGVIISTSAFLYLPATHDSLSYRIPRMYLWLQEGHLGYLPTSDDRINYMTHNWELASLPILQAFGPRALPMLSVFSWIILYFLGRDWARIAGFPNPLRNWIGLLPALSTFSVLQARSTVNDLFAATLILASAWFAISFRRSPDPWKLTLSAFALVLACGTKPHYIVLGAPWGAWFIFAKPAPWRLVPWRQVCWLLPLFLFVSPLSAFLINTIETGTFKGTTSTGDFIGGDPALNISFGTISFLWQALQPPLNPLAGIWNSSILGSPLLDAVTHDVPRFGLRINYAQIVDSASVGLFVMVPCLLGFGLSLQTKQARDFRWVACAGAVGFLLAVSQVVPGSIGRSFMGFAFLFFPLAMAGLSLLSPAINKVLITAAILAAVASTTFDASRPLFPARHFAAYVEGTGFAPLLETFLAFRERSNAGADLFRQIPEQSRVVVISGGGDPLVALWTEAHPATVHLAPADATLEWVRSLNPDAIIVTGTGPEMHASLIGEITKHFRLIGTGTYLVRLQRGMEKWELFAP